MPKKPRKPQAELDKSKQIQISANVSISAIVGVLLIFFFGTGVTGLITHYATVASAHLFEDRELEILSYRRQGSDSPAQIHGILHPEKIEVDTDDNSVSLMSFNGSNSIVQMEPTEEMVVGKRVKVKYYVGKIEDHRWWYPATIHNHIEFSEKGIFRIWATTIGSFVLMASCFVYAYYTNRKFQAPS